MVFIEKKFPYIPTILKTEKEAIEFITSHVMKIWRVVLYIPTLQDEPINDNYIFKKILKTISNFSMLRYGDCRDVAYITEYGVEYSKCMPPAYDYTNCGGDLTYTLSCIRMAKLEFSIPKNKHLLANLSRALYNIHPWGEMAMPIR